jgi:hypothetical protein
MHNKDATVHDICVPIIERVRMFNDVVHRGSPTYSADALMLRSQVATGAFYGVDELDTMGAYRVTASDIDSIAIVVGASGIPHQVPASASARLTTTTLPRHPPHARLAQSWNAHDAERIIEMRRTEMSGHGVDDDGVDCAFEAVLHLSTVMDMFRRATPASATDVIAVAKRYATAPRTSPEANAAQAELIAALRSDMDIGSSDPADATRILEHVISLCAVADVDMRWSIRDVACEYCGARTSRGSPILWRQLAAPQDDLSKCCALCGYAMDAVDPRPAAVFPAVSPRK